jgi:hypothetical protein
MFDLANDDRIDDTKRALGRNMNAMQEASPGRDYRQVA